MNGGNGGTKAGVSSIRDCARDFQRLRQSGKGRAMTSSIAVEFMGSPATSWAGGGFWAKPRHGAVELDKLHKLLFYVNSHSLAETGSLMFADNAIALPSGPVFPRLDVDLGYARWRRRFEARYGTKGRRGARRIPPMATLISEAA